MAFILYAVPVFLLLIAVEVAIDRWRGTGYYRWSDSISSLSAGALSQVSVLLTAGFGAVFYMQVFDHLALFTLPSQSLWVWVLAFFLYDLTYYWAHRISHERNLFWAAHVVHHQSEEFNLTTALRQESTTFLASWIFILPMALLGIPPVVLGTVVVIVLYYQVWVHTRHLPKLGWFEWIFVTPSHHRVHHAQNPIYMDRNHAGVLIIWDRLFGTYAEERDDEPVTFGITTPLASWNPLWANVQFYAQLWRDAVHASSWWDKVRIWFMPTGWRPVDVAARYPLAKPVLSQFVKFEVPLTSVQKIYALFQYVVCTLGLTWLVVIAAEHGFGNILIASCWITFGLYTIGVWLENRPWALKLEVSRLLLNVPALWLMQQVGLVPQGETAWLVLLAYSLLSGMFLWLPRRRDAAVAHPVQA